MFTGPPAASINDCSVAAGTPPSIAIAPLLLRLLPPHYPTWTICQFETGQKRCSWANRHQTTTEEDVMLPETMRAARMYDVGAEMVIEEVAVPQPGPLDVVVKVHACNVVPNLGNVLRNWTTSFPQL